MAWITIRVDTGTTVTLGFYYGEGETDNRTIEGDNYAGSGDGYVSYWGPSYIRVVSWTGGNTLHVAGYTDGGSTRLDTDVSAGYIIYNPYRLRFYARNTAPPSYTLTYDGNGATGGSTAPQTGATQYTVRSNGFTRTGHTFLYWSDPVGNIYNPGDTITIYSNTTLKAQWVLNTYSVTYDTVGGTGGPDGGTKQYGVDYTIPNDVPTKAGNQFLYWQDNHDTGIHWNPGDSYTTNANVEFRATWKLNTYTVSYNANRGTGAPGSQTKIYGIALTLSSTKPTRDGYVFLGWGLSSSTTTVNYQPGDSYYDNVSRMLYAVWAERSYFYWHGVSDNNDATYFAAGKRIDLAVTAESWNRLCAFVNDVRSYAGLPAADLKTVKAGDNFSAGKFNDVSNAIKEIVYAGYGRHVPSTVSPGQEVTTDLFNGLDGLKASINSCMSEL